jgi:DNA-binding IclR family transcriptional regulator
MVTSVLKALNILELFTPQQPVLTLNDITQKVGYPKSTVHSMLSTLVSKGYVEKTGANSYALGKRFIPMTQAVLVNVQLRDRAAPLLRELGDTTGESVYLTVLDGNLSLYIYAIETSHRLLARSAVGDEVPLHCTSVGKAILAFLPSDHQKAILDEVGQPAYTGNTITDRETLMEDLKKTVERGYSLDNEEHEIDSYCIGAPIFNERGEVVASCSISGHEKSVISDKLDYFSSRVKYTAQEVSRRMGFVPTNLKQIWRDVER